EPDDFISPNERPTQLSRPKGLPQPEPEQSHPQPAPKPKNKVVSISEFTGKPSNTPPVPEVSGIDWEELDRMEAWVLRKLKSMGIARTRKLIRLHVTKGRLSKDMAAALMQFVALYDQQMEKRQQDQQSPTQAEDNQDEGEQNLILRLIAGVSSTGTNRNKGRKHG
ncbi:MAG: hypothetical protein KC496_05440, partial [Anaerolineae bacterium]|nr:hypothetical protein [Anaerolineae bacterium]